MSLFIRNVFKTVNKRTARCLSISARNQTSGDNNILKSGLPDVNIPNTSIDEYIFSNCDKYHDLVATECGVTGRRYTYENLRNRVVNLNRALRKKLGLGKGDVLAILLPNTPEFVLVAVGALKAGLVVTTINPIYTTEEISRQLDDSATKVIVTLNQLYPVAKAATDKLKINIPIITIRTEQGQATPEGALNFDEFVENIDYYDVAPADYEEVAFLPYSSGTTGLPKGVQITHKNILSNLLAFNYPQIGIVHDTTKEHQDVIPAVLPKFHIYGLVANTLNLAFRGVKVVTLPTFDPKLYLATLRAHKPDVLFLVPPLVHFLTAHPMVTPQDLASIRVLTSGAAPLGATDEERFLRKAAKEIAIFQGYGLTETSPMVSMSRIKEVSDPSTLEKRGGSIGKIVASTFGKVVDPNDAEDRALGPNEAGELLVKGHQVMKGYHNKPEEDAKVFTKDGWFRTGDIVVYNDDGFLFVKDRLKELIKVKGYQVPPAELEEVIRDFPEVEDAAVIGVPHPTNGESPRAYVVPKSGKVIDIGKLNAFVNQKVAEYKRLRGGVEVVEGIPKNASGKIMRRQLKLQYEAAMK